ncbi:MAG: NADP-dependent isocitrate dehydrogenase [Verrucomicrobiales bacterium]|nr:NADP-dependent isocitrate dehydrogenase [Verrucomicrobiales bacterium]
MKTHPVTLIPGDGIGPEVVHAAQRIIDASGVRIAWETAHAGASVFLKGVASGVPADTIDSISRTRVALKGPLETPVGHGEKSANVTLRKLFETFANLRPIREFPGVPTPYAGRGIDLVVVRENVEDLYAGIEHMQTPGVAQCLKLISHKGCEKIARLAFEVARAQGRTSVHCATKANIMKLTEGLLKRTFESLAPEFPDLKAQHIVVDNCAHQLVKKPEQFEVIVTTNMNGDILSDLTSALVGGLGFAPSANLGHEVAIFEAVHGSAPKYAGKDVANPTALILSGVMMLRHLGEMAAAERIENAVLVTLADGRSVTRDVVGDERAAGTTAFADAVIGNLGRTPAEVQARSQKPLKVPVRGDRIVTVQPKTRSDLGMDIFIEAALQPAVLGDLLTGLAGPAGFKLKMISNRGTQVYPSRGAGTDCIDHWRCRFLDLQPAATPDLARVHRLLESIETAGLRWMQIEKLPEFDGQPGFTKAQGED